MAKEIASPMPNDQPLSPAQHIVCAVPLLMIFHGGLLGGGIGGAAWGLNQTIMRSSLSIAGRYILVIFTSIIAVLIYLVVVVILLGYFSTSVEDTFSEVAQST